MQKLPTKESCGTILMIFFSIPKITFFPVNIFPETRPVKTVYSSDPVLDLRFCLHRCKDCLIAAFGMSANHQRGIAGVFCNVPQIEPCRRLRRNRAFQCHIKIFSPADDRLICPAKCHIHRSVFQQKCNCRELHRISLSVRLV